MKPAFLACSRLALFAAVLATLPGAGLPVAAQNSPVGRPPEPENIVDAGSGQRPATTPPPSSTGAQRVVRQRQSPWSGLLGASFDYLYRSNALSVNEPIGDEIRSDVLVLLGYGALGYGPIKTGSIAVTEFYLGALMQSNLHQEEEVEFADFRTQNVYLMADTTFMNGWALASRLEYSENINEDSGHTDYSEISPSLSLRRFWKVGPAGAFRAIARVGYHFSDIDDYGGLSGRTANQLNHWNNSLTTDYFWVRGPLVLNPTLRFGHKSYQNGQNAERWDFVYQAGFRATWRFRFLQLSAFTTYTTQSSDLETSEFDNWDAGVGASSTHRW